MQLRWLQIIWHRSGRFILKSTSKLSLPTGFLIRQNARPIWLSCSRPIKGPLIARKLANYSLGLYASRHYLKTHHEPETAEDLQHHTLIGYIPDFIYAEELRYLSEIDDNLSPALSSSSINVQLALTRSALGVCVLPNFIGRFDDALTPIIPAIQIRRSFWIVVHRDLAKVARLRAVIDWLDQLVHAPDVIGKNFD